MPSRRFPLVFRWLLAAEMVSLFGSLVSRTALPFVAILFLNARAWEVALLSVADVLAGLVSALLLGALIDRTRKRRVMLIADVLRALLMALVPLGAWLGWLTVPLLFGIAFACGVLGVAFELAYAALLPRLVAADDLLAANSRIAAGQAVVETASFGIGGWWVQWLGAPLAVLADALSFAVSAWLLWRAPEVDNDVACAPRAAERGVWREAGEGLRVVWRDPVLRALAMVEFFVAGGSAMFGAMFLLFLGRDLGFAPGLLGLVFAVGGVSSFFGAVLAERFSARWPAGPLMVGGLALVAVSMCLPPLVTGMGAAAIALLVGQQLLGDGGGTLYQINDHAMRQTRSPVALLARVQAAIRVVGMAAMLLGAGVAGAVGEAAGARAALALAAATVALGVLVALASRLRSLGS